MMVSFGNWVQTRRNQLRMSRTVLAKKIACAPVTIKKIERDERRPSEQLAELLAIHLQIPADEQDDFIRRARGEYVPSLRLPSEMTISEAQISAQEEETPRHNLPVQTTAFIGRKVELHTISTNLAEPDCRLLTILGAGGMGKTRLGIAAAHEQTANFTDGVVYVALASIPAVDSNASIDPLVKAVADALRISLNATDAPKQQLVTYLCRKEMLLLLDNFEHLLATADFVAELLLAAPDIKIVVTSRERLNLQEEWVYTLQGLSFPKVSHVTDNKALQDCDAVQLFARRARQLQSTLDLDRELPAILKICQLVDGMPLGLELASAWIGQMDSATIAQEITTGIDVLATNLRNIPERHRSIRAIFATSWQQLSESERMTLQKLAIFRGGVKREAAQTVARATLFSLSRLVDKSLLTVLENGRYELHELLRQFIIERLHNSSKLSEDAFRNHARYFVGFVEQLEHFLYSSQQTQTIDQIRLEQDNIRQAVDWAFENGQIEWGQRIFVALRYYLMTAGLPGDAARWIVLAEQHMSGVTKLLQGRVLHTIGFLHRWVLGDMEAAILSLERALVQFRQLEADILIALTLQHLSMCYYDQPEQYDRGIALARESLAIFSTIESTPDYSFGYSRFPLIVYERLKKNFDNAVEVANVALSEMANNQFGLVLIKVELAVLALLEARLKAVAEILHETLPMALEVAWNWQVLSLVTVGAGLLVESGELEGAGTLVGFIDEHADDATINVMVLNYPEFKTIHDRIRSALDEPTFAAAVQTGRHMSQADTAAMIIDFASGVGNQ